jgi:transcriptional regulator with XRE-family HTH domain
MERIQSLSKYSNSFNVQHAGSTMKINQKDFGKRIRFLRKQRHLTQERLAEISGLSVDGIRRLERGAFSPSLATLVSLCNGLEVSISTLFGPFEGMRRTDVLEFCDYMAQRTPDEVGLSFRVIKALFDDHK